MKRNILLKPIIYVLLGLVAGLLIGLSINGSPPFDDELTGSIGKVDNNRNVRVAEKDILLRNELVEDTVRLVQYRKYLSYVYYKSLKTSIDIERVINLTADESEFLQSLSLDQTLEGYKKYLETARANLISALHALENQDMNVKVPIIEYLNEANNAASRIRSNDEVLLNYLDAIETYIASHPEKDCQKLKDAHDLLALNVLQTAMIAKNKPLLKYLDDKKIYANYLNLKALINDSLQKIEMNVFMAQDKTGIENFNEQSSQKILKGIEALNVINGFVIHSFSAMSVLNNASLINSAESLRAINNQQTLSMGFTDQQTLGLYLNDLQIINGQALGDLSNPL